MRQFEKIPGRWIVLLRIAKPLRRGKEAYQDEPVSTALASARALKRPVYGDIFPRAEVRGNARNRAGNFTADRGLVRFNNGRTLAGTQDDDDYHDHDDWTWVAVVVGGAVVAGIITYIVLRDDELVSPVR